MESKIKILNKTISIYSPLNYILNQYNYIDKLQHKLNSGISNGISYKKAELAKALALLEAHNPLNVLKKGYSIIEDLEGTVLTRREELKVKKFIKITLQDGSIKTEIHNSEEI
jgi:exodeoxyribonuclease VII large subunit